jgi:hypothetical protein
MAKFFTELIIFAFILLQIVMLTSYTHKEDSTTKSATIAIGKDDINTIYNLSEKDPDAYLIASHVEDKDVLKYLAEKEAQRILETGDTSRLQKEIEENRPILRLLGYNF